MVKIMDNKNLSLIKVAPTSYLVDGFSSRSISTTDKSIYMIDLQLNHWHIDVIVHENMYDGKSCQTLATRQIELPNQTIFVLLDACLADKNGKKWDTLVYCHVSHTLTLLHGVTGITGDVLSPSNK